MGLDQSLYIVKKPPEDFDWDSWEDDEHNDWCKSKVRLDDDDCKEALRDLMPYGIVRDYEVLIRIEWDKLLEPYGLSKDDKIGMVMRGGYTTLTFKNGSSVEFTQEQVEAHCVYDMVPHLVWLYQELKYLRNAYDINEMVANNYEHFDDCCYVNVGGDTELLNEIYGNIGWVPCPVDGCGLMYYAWW